jgi:hypothetical protein
MRSHYVELGLFFLSLSVFIYLKKDFVCGWDCFEYIKAMYLERHSSLFFGRMGYVYFFIPIWNFVKIFGVSILDFHHFVRYTNILFASLTVVVFYLLVTKLFQDKIVGAGAALLLLFSKDFVAYATSIHTEIMMMCVLVVSFYFYVAAHEKKVNGLLYLSGFFFGYALSIRERAVFTAIFFFTYFLIGRNQQKFTFRNYCYFTIIIIATAGIGPLIVLLTQGMDYLRVGLYGTQFYTLHLTIEDAQHVYRILRDGYGLLLISYLGFIFLVVEKQFRKLAYSLSLFLPVVILTFYGQAAPKYFVVGYFSLAMLEAYALKYITKALRFPHILYALGVLTLALMNVIDFVPEIQEDNEYCNSLETYGLRLLEIAPESSVFLVGKHSSLIGHYFIPLTQSSHSVVWSGWSWPGDNLTNVIRKFTKNNRTVIVDFATYSGDERQDLINALHEFDFMWFSDGLHTLQLKDSPAER